MISILRWLILFDVRMLKVAKLILFLHLSKFGLGTVANFLNTAHRSATLFSRVKSNAF